MLILLCAAAIGAAYFLKPLNCIFGAKTDVGSLRYYSLFPSKEIRQLVHLLSEEDLTYIVDGDPGIGSPREYIEIAGDASNLKETIVGHLKSRGFDARLETGEIEGVWTNTDGIEIIVGEYGGRRALKVFIGI